MVVFHEDRYKWVPHTKLVNMIIVKIVPQFKVNFEMEYHKPPLTLTNLWMALILPSSPLCSSLFHHGLSSICRYAGRGVVHHVVEFGALG